MKTPIRMIVLVLGLAVVITGVSLVSVSAENSKMSTKHIENIRTNCILAKNTINQLHASDALLRVNMGQLYELMSTRLMDRFNSRVANNGYDNSSLKAVTSAYNAKLDSFRTDYQSYEVQLAQTLKIDCVNQPVAFYDSAVSARSKRDQVHVDVARLNQYLKDYKTALNAFDNSYKVKQGDSK